MHDRLLFEHLMPQVFVGRQDQEGLAGVLLGVLAVGDTVRPGAAAALKAIHAAGVEKIVVLSGDNQRTASAIAVQAGIDEAHRDLLPGDKIGKVRRLAAEFRYRHDRDGLNDAPAMAAETVGIAMGQAGTETAIEAADVALMQEDLGMVAQAILASPA